MPQPFPSNFAQTGRSFLQQDPFAGAGGIAGNLAAARFRTLSTGNSPLQYQTAQNNASPWLDGLNQGASTLPNPSLPLYQPAFDAFGNPSGAAAQNLLHALRMPGLSLPNQLPQMSQNNSPVGITQAQMQSPFQQTGQAGQAVTQGSPDDVIPTAIVIKNIPFALPYTSLLAIIDELTLSAPYAFNYHYDQGVFRGLAFANFHSPEETDACVAALNGYEIQGRKLRVEYKKVLQAGEKERIERDKAIKRMRSMQLERERLIMNQPSHMHMQPPQYLNAHFQQPPVSQDLYNLNQLSNGDIRKHNNQPSEDWEDYGRAMPSGTGSQDLSSLNGNARDGASVTSSNDFGMPDSSNGSSSSRAGVSPYELDMNDPQTLEIYSRVLLFKDDSLRDELAFSRNLTATQRRIVKLVGQKLGMNHRSIGAGEDRHVVVVKPSNNSLTQQRTLRTRASTHHLLSPDLHSEYAHSGSGSPSPNMRKKSMPDLRHQQQYPYNSQMISQGLPSPGSNLLSGGQHDSITPRHSAYDLRAANRRSALMNGIDLSSNPIIGPGPPGLPSSASSPALQSVVGSSALDLVANVGTLPGRSNLSFASPAQTPGAGIREAQDIQPPLSKAVGSPANTLRQPRGPDSSTSWARGSPFANAASPDVMRKQRHWHEVEMS